METPIADEQRLEFNESQGQQTWVNGEVAYYDPPAPPLHLPRAASRYGALAIIDVAPWSDGMLLDAVEAAIEAIADPLQRSAAKRTFKRGSDFDRDDEEGFVLKVSVAPT
jgi:hypothetical protein